MALLRELAKWGRNLKTALERDLEESNKMMEKRFRDYASFKPMIEEILDNLDNPDYDVEAAMDKVRATPEYKRLYPEGDSEIIRRIKLDRLKARAPDPNVRL